MSFAEVTPVLGFVVFVLLVEEVADLTDLTDPGPLVDILTDLAMEVRLKVLPR